MGKAEEFLQIKTNIFGQFIHEDESYKEIINNIKKIFELTDISLDKLFFIELKEIYDEILSSSNYQVLVHMDPCPENVIVSTIGELFLIDFEISRYGYLFLDAIYSHMSFPSCWCANKLDQRIVEEMDRVYRK